MKLITVEEVEVLSKRLLRDEFISPPDFPSFPQQFAVSNDLAALGLVERT